MLSAFRNFARSWVAKVLMILLAVSFVGWGAQQMGTGAFTGDQVIKAGSRVVTSLDFRREYDNYRKRYEQQTGQPITPEIAAQNRLDAVVLNGVATREAFGEMLARMGIVPSDKLLVAQIEKMEAFFDPISGRFDKAIFQQRLADNGLTPQLFDTILRDEMAAQHWTAGVQNGLTVPRAYGALAAVFGLESRDLAFFTITPQSVPQPAAPTDAQLTAFMKENASQLTRPETRVLTVVSFQPQAAADGPVDPAELKKRYDFRKDTLSQPETRTVVQIPAKDAAVAQQVAARLQRGEDPAAIARSIGVEPVTYDNKPLTAFPDRAVGQAAFRMAAGQVAPVKGELGVSVLKVVSVTPGREISLEEARPMLEAEIRKDTAAERVYALTQAYDDAHQAGASLAEAAQKAGVPAVTIGPVTQQGIGAQGQPVQGLSQKILETAWNLPAGGESDVAEAGDGSYFAVRVERIIPPSMPPLAEVREPLARAWMQREVGRRMEARGNELSARLKKGETLDAVAASAGYSVTRVPGLSRQNAQANEQLGRELLARAFGAKPGEVFLSQMPPFAMAVAQVSNVRMADGPTAARIAESSRPELTVTLFRELSEAAQRGARNKLKVRVNEERARAAVGLDQFAPKGEAEKKK